MSVKISTSCYDRDPKGEVKFLHYFEAYYFLKLAICTIISMSCNFFIVDDLKNIVNLLRILCVLTVILGFAASGDNLSK